MQNNDFNKNVENFMKWSKICVITANIIGIFSIIPALLTVLKEFASFERTAPYLYGKISVYILLAIYLVLFTIMIISLIKARKYKKLTEKTESDKSEDTDEQTYSDI